MRKTDQRNHVKTMATVALLAMTLMAAYFEYETIFSSAMVGFFLMLTFMDNKAEKSGVNGKAARYAITAFSLIVIILNVIMPVFLPGIVAGMDFTAHTVELTSSLGTNDPEVLREHFLQVNINDMHELCYTTSLLLLIDIISLKVLKIKNVTTQA